jgi:hypothetical protein
MSASFFRNLEIGLNRGRRRGVSILAWHLLFLLLPGTFFNTDDYKSIKGTEEVFVKRESEGKRGKRGRCVKR